jgi:hypothetical protein
MGAEVGGIGWVCDNKYLLQLVYYIHANPQKHGFVAVQPI